MSCHSHTIKRQREPIIHSVNVARKQIYWTLIYKWRKALSRLVTFWNFRILLYSRPKILLSFKEIISISSQVREEWAEANNIYQLSAIYLSVHPSMYLPTYVRTYWSTHWPSIHPSIHRMYNCHLLILIWKHTLSFSAFSCCLLHCICRWPHVLYELVALLLIYWVHFPWMWRRNCCGKHLGN